MEKSNYVMGALYIRITCRFLSHPRTHGQRNRPFANEFCKDQMQRFSDTGCDYEKKIPIPKKKKKMKEIKRTRSKGI